MLVISYTNFENLRAVCAPRNILHIARAVVDFMQTLSNAIEIIVIFVSSVSFPPLLIFNRNKTVTHILELGTMSEN